MANGHRAIPWINIEDDKTGEVVMKHLNKNQLGPPTPFLMLAHVQTLNDDISIYSPSLPFAP
jgi:hypothetical protein